MKVFTEDGRGSFSAASRILGAIPGKKSERFGATAILRRKRKEKFPTNQRRPAPVAAKGLFDEATNHCGWQFVKNADSAAFDKERTTRGKQTLHAPSAASPARVQTLLFRLPPVKFRRIFSKEKGNRQDAEGLAPVEAHAQQQLRPAAGDCLCLGVSFRQHGVCD